MVSQSDLLKQQSEEIERLRAELERVKTSGEVVYPLPHTLRKGFGDLWRGNVRGRERPDNVPVVETAPVSGPSNKDVIEAMAAQAIKAADVAGTKGE